MSIATVLLLIAIIHGNILFITLMIKIYRLKSLNSKSDVHKIYENSMTLKSPQFFLKVISNHKFHENELL